MKFGKVGRAERTEMSEKTVYVIADWNSDSSGLMTRLDDYGRDNGFTVLRHDPKDLGSKEKEPFFFERAEYWGIAQNILALNRCFAVLLVVPCTAWAETFAAFAAGMGKPVIIWEMEAASPHLWMAAAFIVTDSLDYIFGTLKLMANCGRKS
jgi:hypothetical protein